MLSDLRFGIRSLARRRSYAAACVVTLGLATSVPFAALALVDAALLRPIPLHEPDRVFTLRTREGDTGFLYRELERVLGLTGVFEAVAGRGRYGVSVATEAGAHRMGVSFVTERFFDVVGHRPALGRGFAPAEHRIGAAPVVVVTDAFWRARLGGDPTAIGRTIGIAGREAVVVGVLPRGFRGLSLDAPVEVFMPLFAAALVAPPGNYFDDGTVVVDGSAYDPMRWISITARLKAGASAAGAEAALNTMPGVDGRARTGPAGGAFRLARTTRVALSPRIRAQVVEFVGMLVAASGLILFAGCAGVAGMMLVRQDRRRREMAVRSWLGAGRLRIVRLFLVEAMLLTSVGAAAGLLIARWLGQAAGSLVTLPGGVEMTAWPPGGAGRMAGLAALAAVLTGVLCGLAPALRSVDLRRGRSGRWRGTVLAGQVAVVVALTIGAGLFIRSMQAVAGADVGFESRGLAYATVAFDDRGHVERLARARDLYHRVVPRLAARPGVEAVTFGNLPLVGNPLSGARVEVDGGIRELPARLEVFFGGPGYVRTLGLRLLAGRDLGDRDVEGREPVAVVSAALARRLWGERDPLGARFTSLPLRDVRVVGVVGDGRFGRRLRDTAGFAAFLPWEQNRLLASWSGAVFGRTAGDAGALADAMRREIRAFDGDLRITAAQTFRDRLGALGSPQRVGAVILSGLGGFALLLAVVGVYGSVTQAAAGRAREIGIRIALGARRADVVGTLSSRTLAYAGIGAAAGVGAAAAFGALAEPHLFEVAPRDPATYAAMTSAVAAAAALAGLAAALRASRAAAARRLIREIAAAE